MARGRIYVARSSIHGRGVFAAETFKRGERIAAALGTPTETNGPHVLWVPGDGGSYQGLKVVNHLRYLNYSPKANAGFWGVELYAIRAIRAEEEITLQQHGSG